MNTDIPWISCKEAAEALNFTQRHIVNLIKKGKLKAECDNGKYFIPKDDFFRVFPHAVKQDENKCIENITIKFLEEKIRYLEDTIVEKRKENEFLREQLNRATSEKSKMLDTQNGYIKFLEQKVARDKLISTETEI